MGIHPCGAKSKRERGRRGRALIRQSSGTRTTPPASGRSRGSGRGSVLRESIQLPLVSGRQFIINSIKVQLSWKWRSLVSIPHA